MRQDIRFCHAADGTRIAYATSGEGPPLVRVAHWMTHLDLDWESPLWRHWFAELSQDHTLVRYDPRGSGLSDRTVPAPDIDAWVGDVEAVVDDLGLDSFALIGLCQGGSVAVAYAARHPERVRRMVLYDGYVQGAFRQCEGSPVQRTAETLAEMIDVGWGLQTSAFRRVFAELLIPGASDEQQRWLADLQRRTVDTRTAVRLWRAFNEVDITAEARRVQVPTMVFHVRGDAMVPFEEGRRLAGLIPGARFVPLRGTNHILLEDDEAWPRFLAELRSFLGDAPEPAGSTAGENVFPELTRREREVLDLVARGLSNDAISDGLNIASKTVRNHISRIYDKLGVRTRAEAVVLARQAGCGRDQDS